MPRRITSVAIAVLAAGLVDALLRAQPAQAPPVAPVSFANDIQPILASRCLSCHGESMQGGRLDLRSRESALEGGARGSDLVPGAAEQSRLYRRVAGVEQPAMPAKGPALTTFEVAAIKRWIDEGARWEATDGRNYWAFKLPAQAPLPDVGNASFTNPVDRFLESARRARGLRAAPRADRFTLVRRAYLDVLGLPPTPAQVDAYVSDRSPDAWERLV